MKKTFCTLIGLLTAAVLALCGCGGKVKVYDRADRVAVDVGEQTYTLAQNGRNTYYNFIELYDGDGDVYDIGDPFVFRHDGKYYLYSSLNGQKRFTGKIPCWVSDNLVDWEWGGWAYGEGRAENPETTIACAPEVIYYQGYFYLTESETGNGHYFFRSTSPTGPFTRITANLGQKIDGSFYLADDGNLYFMSATGGGIAYMPVTIVERGAEVGLTLGKAVVVPEATLSNMWTEGPGHFSRNGYSYLTYTGNHVDSPAYRVGYSYTDAAFLFDGLRSHENNVTLVGNGEDDAAAPIGYAGNLVSAQTKFSSYRGVGHSSNVIGPDLDSVYTAYHNARRINYNNVQEGSERKYNLTRYYTNGGYLLADSLGNFAIDKPTRPDFSATADELETVDGLRLSAQSTPAVYTAELNFTAPQGRAALYVGYTDAENHTEITVAGGRLGVTRMSEGRRAVLGSCEIALGSNAAAVHTVRVVNGAFGSEIYFDSMKKITVDGTVGAGKIGYAAGTAASWTQFTADAFGTSDFDAVKNLTGAFPAYAYVKGENKGFSLAGAQPDRNGVRQGEPEKTVRTDDGFAVALEPQDWVKYNVNAPTQGWYDLTATVSAASRGATIEVIVDGEAVYPMHVDETDFGDSAYTDISCGKFFIDKGLHTLKIRVFDGTFTVKNFRTEKNAQPVGDIREPLTSKPADVRTLIGYSYFDGDGMVINEFLDRTMSYWGQRGMADYQFSVDMTLPPRTVLASNFGGGFLFRAKNYHYAANAKVSANLYGWQGYFLQVSNTGLTLYKCNFNQKVLATYDLENGKLLFGSGGEFVRIRVRAYHNELEVWLNGTSIMRVTDANQPFTTGYIGFYGAGSEMLCKNFTFGEI